MRESSSMFCDKKLVAINHLYNIQSSQAILSVRGTVRGIKNRVRAGIETFAGEKVRRRRRCLVINDKVSAPTSPQ